MSNPIRVMYFASTSEKSGGSLHSLVELAGKLKKDGYVVPLIILPDKGDGEGLLKEHNLDYRIYLSYGSEWPLGQKKSMRQRASHFKQRLQNLKSIRQIVKLAKSWKPDLIHINTSVNEIGYYVAKRIKKPFVWHIREFVQEGLGLEFYSPKKVYAHMKKANAIIAISSALQNRYSKLLAPKNILLVHNGIDCGLFSRATALDKKSEALRIVMIGRISHLKGHYDVVDSLAILKQRRPDLRISLKMIGSDDGEISDYAKSKQVDDQIEVLGYINDVRKILWESDIYISGHPYEAFGRATAEAMAAGCCVIGVRSGGTLDLIKEGETGFLYSCHEISNLATVLEYLADNKGIAKEIGLASSEYVKDVFSIDRLEDRIQIIYKDIIDHCEYS